MTEHVWYFADVNKIRVATCEDHWFMRWFCGPSPHAIYLGEL
jgi:hypothetical protein